MPTGSPPRVRGTGLLLRLRSRPHRITPAGAGNRQELTETRTRLRDHPRGCGEQLLSCTVLSMWNGSPPRVRGTVKAMAVIYATLRITPAGAGNSLYPLFSCMPSWDHPRGCGEQEDLEAIKAYASGSPPRVRGTVSALFSPMAESGITPAGAGNSEPFCHCSAPP